MKKEQYNNVWQNCAVIRPAFVMTRDVDRLSGMVTYKKGALLYGTDSRNTFWNVTPEYNTHNDTGNVGLPLSAVKFLGYVNINMSDDGIISQIKELQDA